MVLGNYDVIYDVIFQSLCFELFTINRKIIVQVSSHRIWWCSHIVYYFTSMPMWSWPHSDIKMPSCHDITSMPIWLWCAVSHHIDHNMIILHCQSRCEKVYTRVPLFQGPGSLPPCSLPPQPSSALSSSTIPPSPCGRVAPPLAAADSEARLLTRTT